MTFFLGVGTYCSTHGWSQAHTCPWCGRCPTCGQRVRPWGWTPCVPYRPPRPVIPMSPPPPMWYGNPVADAIRARS